MTDVKHDSRQPRILAITGGKGGVGKTSVALNLSLTLAREGQRVLLLDGDTDLANVTIMLGQYPKRTLAEVVDQQCSLEQAIMEAPFGLHIIPGASGVEQCMGMAASDSFDLLRSLATVERRYDYILIDTAAGLQPVVLHMIAAAGMACVVVTPDPTSLTDAFSLLKVLKRRGYQRTPSVLVNMAQGASQARSVFQRFAAASQRHLNIQPHYLGAIWRDETLRQSVANQRPVALMPESDPSCRQFRVLADMVKVRLDQLPRRKAGIAAYWHRLTRRAQTAATPAEPQPTAAALSATADPAVLLQQTISRLGDLLEDPGVSAVLRYEAFAACFALLGRKMNDDTVETIQTGLAALDWQALPAPHRKQFAAHLRHLADEISPLTARPNLRVKPEPHYDHVIFGDQERLLKAMREQPDDVSLDRFLRSLASSGESDTEH